MRRRRADVRREPARRAGSARGSLGGTVPRGDPSVPRRALGTRSVFMRAPPARLAGSLRTLSRPLPPVPSRPPRVAHQHPRGAARPPRRVTVTIRRPTNAAQEPLPVPPRPVRRCGPGGTRRGGGARIKTERAPSARRGTEGSPRGTVPPRDLRAPPARLAGSLRTSALLRRMGNGLSLLVDVGCSQHPLSHNERPSQCPAPVRPISFSVTSRLADFAAAEHTAIGF